MVIQNWITGYGSSLRYQNFDIVRQFIIYNYVPANEIWSFLNVMIIFNITYNLLQLTGLQKRTIRWPKQATTYFFHISSTYKHAQHISDKNQMSRQFSDLTATWHKTGAHDAQITGLQTNFFFTTVWEHSQKTILIVPKWM